MKYQRYFKSDQQLLLRVKTDESNEGRTELITVHVVSFEGDLLTVSLPYGPNAVEHYPFRAEMLFEINSEALGMGIKATASFVSKIDGSSFSIRLNSDLQAFQRRVSERIDTRLGIRFSRAGNGLHDMRQTWEKNLEVLYSPEAPLIYDGFKPARINISSGGIRLTIKPPANQGELCLVLINLDDGKPPVCAIAEIVWSCMQDENALSAGMRFINILSEDQLRIEAYIRQQKK